MLSAQIRVSGRAYGWILRSNGATTKEVSRSLLLGVVSNALPQHAEDDEIPVLAMHAGSAQLDHFPSQRFEYIELKFLGAIVTEIRRRIMARLQTVRPNNLSRGQVLHDEVVANGIKPVFVKTGEMRLLKPFVQFDVEDVITQGLRGPNVLRVAR